MPKIRFSDVKKGSIIKYNSNYFYVVENACTESPSWCFLLKLPNAPDKWDKYIRASPFTFLNSGYDNISPEETVELIKGVV